MIKLKALTIVADELPTTEKEGGNMGEAYKCDLCDKYYQGKPPFQALITDMSADPRDRPTKVTLMVCPYCGERLWKKLEK